MNGNEARKIPLDESPLAHSNPAHNGNICRVCGISDPTVHDGQCYQCRTGRKWEKHHPYGKAVPIVIPIPANQHRILSARQTEWPGCVNHPETPLDWLALLAYGTSDMLWWLAELLKRTGAYLVGVAGRMQATDGDNWNKQFAPLGRIEGAS